MKGKGLFVLYVVYRVIFLSNDMAIGHLIEAGFFCVWRSEVNDIWCEDKRFLIHGLWVIGVIYVVPTCGDFVIPLHFVSLAVIKPEG